MPRLLIHGECREALGELAPTCIDALVTDPPAGIGFMGKDWDDYRRAANAADVGRHNAFGRLSASAPELGRAKAGFIRTMTPIFSECLRVLKPGAHGLIWAIPRTSHWTATALEDAGFDVRDRISHLFATGFPKSLTENTGMPAGQGTALKPACEDWWLVRRPPEGTIAHNVQQHGTGGLQIDACRIPGQKRHPGDYIDETGGSGASITTKRRDRAAFDDTQGRWPPHLVLDEGAATVLEGAAKFFFVAKPSRKEKDAGCEQLAKRTGGQATTRKDGSAGLRSPRAGSGRNGGARNFHPTVKSIALMRWLCRLVTPPGGVILDPFAGSGTTGLAAVSEGFGFIGIEQDEQYVRIAHARSTAAVEPMEASHG